MSHQLYQINQTQDELLRSGIQFFFCDYFYVNDRCHGAFIFIKEAYHSGKGGPMRTYDNR